MLFYSILFDFIPYELANKGKGADWHFLGALAIVYDYTTNFHLLVLNTCPRGGGGWLGCLSGAPVQILNFIWPPYSNFL